MEKQVAAVAADTSLTNPKKIDAFPKASAYARDTSKAYFQLRRTLEHHGDLPKETSAIPYYRTALFVDDIEVTTLPCRVTSGQFVTIKLIAEQKQFPAGTKIVLSPQGAHDLVFTMRVALAPEIFRSHIES